MNVEQPRARRHLAGGAFVSLVVQLLSLGLALPMSVVIARTTGPTGSGRYGVAIALLATAQTVFGLGLTAGLTFHVSRRAPAAASAWRDATRVAAVLGSCGGILIVVVQIVGHTSFLRGVTLPMALCIGAALPFALACVYGAAIAVATERYELYGVASVIQALTAIAVGVSLVFTLGVLGAVIGVCVSFPVAVIIWRAKLATSPAPAALPALGRPRLHSLLSFGTRAWAADLLQLLNYRLDLFILNAFVERAAVGRYSIAVSLTALAWILPGSLQTVLFPRAAQLDFDRASDETLITALRHSVVLLTISLIAVCALLAAIPLIYGSQFDAAIRFGAILLPGVLAIGFAKSLSAVITGRGFPQYSLYNVLATAPITVVLYLVLIPRLGGNGAAIASTVSYVASTLIAMRYFKRVTKLGMRAALPSPRSIVQDYYVAARNARSYITAMRQPRRPA